MLVGCSCASRQRSHGPAVALEFFAFWQRLQFSCGDPLVCRNPHVGKAHGQALCWKIIQLTPPVEKYKRVHVLFDGYLFALQRVDCRNPFWNYAPWKPPEEWWAQARRVMFYSPSAMEKKKKNLSVEKIQLKCLRYLFWPFITQGSPPSLGWEVRACVCGGAVL